MVRYSVDPDVPEKTSKSRGSHLRIHFKHVREIAHHTKGMNVDKAIKFCDEVIAFKITVPFVRYTGGIGAKAQGKLTKSPGNAGRYPVKAMKVYRDMLLNAKSNAETKGLNIEELEITHAQCNRAPPGRRRTYRAHGRVGKYASQPAHVEIILTDKSDPVEKAADEPRIKISRKMAAKRRFVKVGGGSK